MWIEIDSDGDSTFILNANAIDITRSPNPIADFASGTYVVEAAVFGFDRGTFDLNSEARLILTRPGNVNAWDDVGSGGDPGAAGSREDNINKRVTGPSALLPGPATASDQILVNYSRTPYQGDAWGSQNSYIDLPYVPGPLMSDDAFDVVSTELDADNLTRPNEKALEVLASLSFATSLGTGRYSGDASDADLVFTNVAYEDPSVYPPSSGVDPRPKALPTNFAGDGPDIGTEYLGCTERLPLGALFRDKDFRGQHFGYTDVMAPLVYRNTVGSGQSTGLASPALEHHEVRLSTATSGVGSPGDVLVHVDGEANNFALDTNFRTHRGGSVFVASGPRPGGSVSLNNSVATATTDHVRTLQGRAMLVRNSVTNVGSNEASAGSELMMLILTSVYDAPIGSSAPTPIRIGTNGTGEGYAAADLYRIEGHPLVRNNTRMLIDSSAIPLTRKA
jgi:hypothetical protein